MRQQVQSLPRRQRVVWTDPGVCCARGTGMVLWCTQVSHTARPQDHCGEECTPITPKTAPGPERGHTAFPWLRRELSLSSSQGVLGSFEIISSRKGCRHGGVPLGSPRSAGREAHTALGSCQQDGSLTNPSVETSRMSSQWGKRLLELRI